MPERRDLISFVLAPPPSLARIDLRPPRELARACCGWRAKLVNSAAGGAKVKAEAGAVHPPIMPPIQTWESYVSGTLHARPLASQLSNTHGASGDTRRRHAARSVARTAISPPRSGMPDWLRARRFTDGTAESGGINNLYRRGCPSRGGRLPTRHEQGHAQESAVLGKREYRCARPSIARGERSRSGWLSKAGGITAVEA